MLNFMCSFRTGNLLTNLVTVGCYCIEGLNCMGIFYQFIAYK
jgi:hypothetical protein